MLAVGALSALYGVLQASVATDLKRLLAYSTTENMGLIFVGVGGGGLFAAAGERAAGRRWRWPPRCCTSRTTRRSRRLLFLAAGSVLRATGLRDLDRLGGLARRMPATTVLFGVGALGASALPPGHGFVASGCCCRR